MMRYPSRKSDGRWLVMESPFSFETYDDAVIATHLTQRAALNACGRSWFTVTRTGAGSDKESWLIEENRVGEFSTETTNHAGLSGGEAHRLKARLVAAGLLYIEGIVP